MEKNNDPEVEITFVFNPLKEIKKKYSNKLTVSELEKMILSKFLLEEQYKKEISLFKKFSSTSKDKTNITNDKYEIDLNDLLAKLLDSQFNSNSILYCPFIPINEIEFVDEEVGDGSFGILHKCKYSKALAGKNYAFKSFKAERESLQTFIKEVSVYSKLNHPAIPKFIGVSFDSVKKNGFLMEYIQGETLLKCIESIDENDKLEYVYQLADVIAYLHSNECIHRDLKPDNIMIGHKKEGNKPQLFLIDYGLSKIEDNNDMATMRTIIKNNKNVYKFLYSEKEDDFQHKSFDIWALGCIIYFLYTKQHPCKINEKEMSKLVEEKKLFFKKEEFKENEFIYEIIKDCCNLDHTKRKTAQEIRDKIFKKIHMKDLKSIKIYII